MAFDTYLESFTKAIADLRSPKIGIEKKTVGTTAVTFATPLTGGIPYLLFSNGATAYYTLEGTTPTLADGTSGAGLVAPSGLYEPVCLAPGETGP